MRQQGANQFDGGMNLDKNPLNISNHELTSALNATVVTMNGNEGVLQNDMGNARVDQAQLPVGYVPVGMKEYGGIVYVASYNPLKGESQIGCFPSPQRNLASEDEGLQAESLKSICEFIKDVYYEVTNGNPESGITYYSDNSGETEIDPNESYYQDPSNTGTGILTSYNSLDLSETVYGDANETSEITFYKKENEIIDTENEIILINDILRSGDKFIVTSTNSFNNLDSNIGANLIKLKVIIKDSEGNGIDITDQLQDYPYDSTDPYPITYEHFRKILNKDNAGTPIDEKYFNVYKNKISGKLYLKEELILPSYINIRISASTVQNAPTERDITFDISAHNEDGTDWVGNNIFDYVLEVKDANGDPVNCSRIQIGPCLLNNKQTIKYEGVYEGEELYYTVYPRYNYGCCDLQNQNCKYGRIDKLKRSGYIDVSSIASGEVKFDNGEFRYFNDHVRGKLVLDYSLEAYTDDSGWDLSRIYLETYDIEDLFTVTGAPHQINSNVIERTSPLGTGVRKEIDLGISNYFGTFSKGLYYDTTNSSFRDFEEGHYYTVRIVAETINQLNPTNKISYESEWYAVITSTITNEDYFDGKSRMYPLKEPDSGLKPKMFYLDWNTEFTREDDGSTIPQIETINNVRGNTSYYQNQHFINTDIESNIKTTPPVDAHDMMAYELSKEGEISYKYKTNTTVDTHVSFPYTAEFTPQLNFDDTTYSIDVDYIGNPTYDGGQYNDGWVRQLIQNQPDTSVLPFEIGWKYRYPTIYVRNGNKITFRYKLLYQFFANLAVNSQRASDPDEKEQRRFTKPLPNIDMFIPYTPFYITDNVVDKANLESVFGPIHCMSDQQDYHIREILPMKWFAYERTGISYSQDSSHDSRQRYNLHACMMNGLTPMDSWNRDSNDESIRLEVSYRENTDVLPYWTQISNGIKNCYSDPPAIIFWYGSRYEPTAINSINHDEWFASPGDTIPSTAGSWYKQWGDRGNHYDSQNKEYHLYRYCFMLILGDDGFYHIANQFNPYRAVQGYDQQGQITKSWGEFDMMYYITKTFNNIYVCQPNQNIDLDYWRNSTDLNDYVYTKPYSIEYKTKVFTIYNKGNGGYVSATPLNLYVNSNLSNFNIHNQDQSRHYATNGSENWYLPKFDLKVGQSNYKMCEKTFTDSVSSPDGTIKVVEFLDSSLEPTPTETWAMLKDYNGEKIIKKAYIYDSNDKLHVTNFQPDRCYMFCGYTNKGDGNTVSYGDISNNPIGGNSEKALLIDINNSDIDQLFKTHVKDPRKCSNNYQDGNIPIRLGYYPASYVKDKTLITQFNDDHSYRLLKYNSGSGKTINRAESNDNSEWAGYWLGDQLARGNNGGDGICFAREKLWKLLKGYIIDFEPLYRQGRMSQSITCPYEYGPNDWSFSDLYHPEYLVGDVATETANIDLKNWMYHDGTGYKGQWRETFQNYQTLYNKPRYKASPYIQSN